MPLLWQTDTGDAPESGASPSPPLRLTLWPHRSLSKRGFVGFIAVTSTLILVPLIPLLGTPVLWGLLPFLVGAVALIWVALSRSYRDGSLTETLTLRRDLIRLVRRNPTGREQEWHANPHWVTVHLHATQGPVKNYVTLRGGGREVEIGAFLSPDERIALRDDLVRALSKLREPAAS